MSLELHPRFCLFGGFRAKRARILFGPDEAGRSCSCFLRVTEETTSRDAYPRTSLFFILPRLYNKLAFRGANRPEPGAQKQFAIPEASTGITLDFPAYVLDQSTGRRYTARGSSSTLVVRTDSIFRLKMMDYNFFFFPTLLVYSKDRDPKKRIWKDTTVPESLKMHFQNVITDHRQL